MPGLQFCNSSGGVAGRISATIDWMRSEWEGRNTTLRPLFEEAPDVSAPDSQRLPSLHQLCHVKPFCRCLLNKPLISPFLHFSCPRQYPKVIPCLGLNGGPDFQHNEAFSFQVATADQAETDRYWNAIVGNGGEESACGWCKDKWGLSWQITPLALTRAITDPDPAAAKRAFDAMMEMKKIDIAAIEAARRG